jgi:hypothetical protein
MGHSVRMTSGRGSRLPIKAAGPRAGERSEVVEELAGGLAVREARDELDIDYDDLDRRMDEVRRGSAVLVPWIEARRQILRDQQETAGAKGKAVQSTRRGMLRP